MSLYYVKLQRAMERAVQDLHRTADELVNELEGSELIERDDPNGDNARAALEGARAWRSRIEEGR